MTPLGIRREQLGEFIGSEQIARDMIAEGWLKPIVQEPKLTLFSTAHIAKAFARLTNGERPAKSSHYQKKKRASK